MQSNIFPHVQLFIFSETKLDLLFPAKKNEQLRVSTIFVQTCANSAHSKNVVSLKMMAVKYDILKCQARE